VAVVRSGLVLALIGLAILGGAAGYALRTAAPGAAVAPDSGENDATVALALSWPFSLDTTPQPRAPSVRPKQAISSPITAPAAGLPDALVVETIAMTPASSFLGPSYGDDGSAADHRWPFSGFLRATGVTP
jgi:hypothetical protein